MKLEKTTTTEAVARPLHVLIPLIKEDIRLAKTAADQAAMPYWIAAGHKLNEAKLQLNHGEFTPWLKVHFPFKQRTANRYMLLAKTHTENGSPDPVSTQAEFYREHIDENFKKAPTWQANVKQVMDRVDTETLNLRNQELKRREEREAERKLALQLIDIGYKALAHKLHPDKGGSREAMARLNNVRTRLKGCA